VDPAERSEPLTPDALPAALVEGFLRLCQGEFGYRLPRTMSRDRDDTTAFFFNTIAEELERVLRTSRQREDRLARTMAHLSDALVRVAAGDFTVEVNRDYGGDATDPRLPRNNTISGLGLRRRRERRAKRIAPLDASCCGARAVERRARNPGNAGPAGADAAIGLSAKQWVLQHGPPIFERPSRWWGRRSRRCTPTKRRAGDSVRRWRVKGASTPPGWKSARLAARHFIRC
jgi:hypothetical protein